MNRIGRNVLGVTAATVVAVLIAVPFAVPPLVERFASAKAAEFGIDAVVRLNLGYCWRNGPGISGRLSVSVPGTSWNLTADFGASFGEWSALVTLPETRFDEKDRLVHLLLKRFPPKGLSDLAFSGTVALTAKAERTFGKPVPVWRAEAPIRDVCASGVNGRRPFSLKGLFVKPGASGIADHVDIAPMFLRLAELNVAKVALTDVRATVRATERALMVSEATAAFCGGQVGVYSLYLDPKTLNTGFTLFLDEVDAGQALALVSGFRGTATGRLHGKIKAFVREGGRAVRLSDAFLYSPPGQGGKLELRDPETFSDTLAVAGLDEATRGNVARALTDLDYSILRLDLRRLEGETARLSIRLSGSATRGGATVPVDLTINLNGELEQLINRGLGYAAKMKGTK